MNRWLHRLLSARTELVYAGLRAGTGLMFSFHGMQKIFGVLTEKPPAFGTQVWLGGIIELVCGLAIAVGLQLRPAAFLASGTMAVAYIQFHWKGQLGAQLLPAVNKGELALVYALLFLYFAARGAGSLSVDAKLRQP
jgi:putative oxidoreductase